jgi:hypothetical protein
LNDRSDFDERAGIALHYTEPVNKAMAFLRGKKTWQQQACVLAKDLTAVQFLSADGDIRLLCCELLSEISPDPEDLYPSPYSTMGAYSFLLFALSLISFCFFRSHCDNFALSCSPNLPIKPSSGLYP